MSSKENPLLNSGNEREMNERQAREDRRPRIDPDVADALQQLSTRNDDLTDQLDSLVVENNELRAKVETLQEDNEELRERLEAVEEENQKLREEKADSERVSALEGDYVCPSCDRQVRASEVTEAYQAEGESGLLGTNYDGPVTDVRCPHCSEKVDVTDNMTDRERVRFTNELREVGVAAGEIVGVDEAVGADEDQDDLEEEDD